jgi:hypothetical protein
VIIASPCKAAYVRTKALIHIDHVSNGQTIKLWIDMSFFWDAPVMMVSIMALDALMQACRAALEAGDFRSEDINGLFKLMVDS